MENTSMTNPVCKWFDVNEPFQHKKFFEGDNVIVEKQPYPSICLKKWMYVFNAKLLRNGCEQ